MPAFFESARVVMVTVRKWGGVCLGRTAPAETTRRYKTNWRSVLRREKREEKGERSRGERSKRRKRASPQVSKRACGVRVGV